MRDRAVMTFALFCSLPLATPAPVFAQISELSGAVMSGDGQTLPAVTVTVTGSNLQGSRTTTSDDRGFYSIRGLPPGEYRVTFELTGFKSQTIGGVRVSPGVSPTVNAFLEPATFGEEIIVTGTYETISTDNLGVKSDTATQVNRIGGVILPPLFLDNTIPLRSDSVISEDATMAMIDLALTRRIAEHIEFRAGVGAGYGDQEVTITRNTGTATRYSGNVLAGEGIATVTYYLTSQGRHKFKTGVEFSQARGDVTKDPGTAAPGAVTEDDNIRVNRFEVGSSFHYVVGRTEYFAGAQYYNYDYTIEHDINIAFTTPAGATADIHGETKLDKSGFRAIAGLNFTLNDRLRLTASGSAGSDSWTVSGGLSWTVR